MFKLKRDNKNLQPTSQSWDERNLWICNQICKTFLESYHKRWSFHKDCLNTFLCEVESILNGRRLTAIRDDITDLEPFTPNHLLIGSSSSKFRPANFNNNEINLKKWRSVQAASDMFWKRWVREYPPSLSIRKK